MDEIAAKFIDVSILLVNSLKLSEEEKSNEIQEKVFFLLASSDKNLSTPKFGDQNKLVKDLAMSSEVDLERPQ